MEFVNLLDTLSFLDMNKELIYMPEDKRGIYNIDESKIDLLIENINENSCLDEIDKENSINFVKRLFKVYKYVPFDDYIALIKKVSLNIMNFLFINHVKYDDIYFCANNQITKSNTWILLLFLDEMKEFLTENEELRNKIKIISTIPSDTEYLSKTIVLYFDDMSYSGTQISEGIPKNIDSEKTTNIDIYITTPIISKTAIEKIHKKNIHIKFWEETTIIGNFHDIFVDGNEEYEKLYDIFCSIKTFRQLKNSWDKLIRGFQCYNDIIPIYFDHKIADGFSTFQKLLNYGIYPLNHTKTCKPTCVITPLINNCDNFIKNTDIKEDLCRMIITDIEYDNTCPNAFYKTFRYHLPHSDINDDTYDSNTLVSFINKYNSLKISDKYRNKYIKIKKLLLT